MLIASYFSESSVSPSTLTEQVEEAAAQTSRLSLSFVNIKKVRFFALQLCVSLGFAILAISVLEIVSSSQS